MSSAMDALKARLFEANAIGMAIAVLDWDQQCNMPHGGGAARAEHVGVLSKLAHESVVSDETQRALEAAEREVDPNTVDGACVRLTRRGLDMETKLPGDFVAEKARASAQAHETWVKARTADDFEAFRPTMEKMVEIARQEAEYLGYKDHIYDALTDKYEEGATKKFWDGMFDQIRQPLTDLVAEIGKKPAPNDAFLTGNWDEAKQREFSLKLMEAIGFDMERGRLDVAAHPFCTNFSVGDVRLTTRFQEFLPTSIFGTLHEAGHGMYEQGSPMEWDRLPVAGGVSLGFHESQSRTWENIVGRSKAFWKFFYPQLQQTLTQFQSISMDDFYRSVNKVEPSLIRVEADELTYNLHILIRFELECEMLEGTLAVKDLPAAWNEKYEKYLGITPPNDKDGCMQDVHWSAALMGYFPTYSMGNILSYQIWSELEKSVGDTNALMEKGEFKPILDWLIDNMYQHGQRFQPQVLLQKLCGGGLDAQPYLNGMTKKYSEIYGL
ncbi:MAG: carboxypeptidase M32 [Armatimonadetes bacterium]|nr:carboxypeptidase M32 [Armatimonadota bacterium]